MMRIGEAADELGINPRTIRYYESIALIPAADRTPGGYRIFGSEDVERLRFIRNAQRLGLTLDEIREVLALRERGEQPCGYVLEVVRRQTDAIDRQVRDLLDLRDELTDLVERAGQVDEGDGRYCRLVESTHGRRAGA